jgi:LacI family transcriptional regulator
VPLEALRQLSAQVPVVVFAGGRTPGDVDAVGVDNRGGARAATRHLLEHGYEQPAYVAGPARSAESNARFKGFCVELTDAGLVAPDRPHVRGDFTERGGFRAALELLRDRPRPPRALVVGNDQMAMGAAKALASAGYSVPRDVALVGFDDIALSRHVRPALTTVRQPMRKLGEECAQLLLRRVAAPDTEAVQSVLPTKLVVRRSCGCKGRTAEVGE